MQENKVYNTSFLNNTLPNKSASLIIADPPYFEVKGEFDFKWNSFDDYLKDVEVWAKECKRLLADNGTLFWWGNSKKIAYSQIILDKFFHLENSMIWQKCDSMQYQYYSIELSRCFNTHNERVLMYSNDYEPNDWNKTGLERIMEEKIKPKHPFALYLKSEFKKAGVSRKEISKLFPSKNGKLTGAVSNWLNGDNTITKEQYLKIRDYLNGEYLRREYEDLRREYEDLRREYEEERRYFNNTLKLEEVLNFSQQSNITRKYKHPTQKALKLTTALIQTTLRKGGLLVVPFAGSGTECVAGIRCGGRVIGFDVEEKYCNIANKRIKEELINQSSRLF